VQETPHEALQLANHGSTIVRGALFLPETANRGPYAAGSPHDISGRRVLDLKPGASDVSRLTPGVYVVADAGGVRRTQRGG